MQIFYKHIQDFDELSQTHPSYSFRRAKENLFKMLSNIIYADISVVAMLRVPIIFLALGVIKNFILTF